MSKIDYNVDKKDRYCDEHLSSIANYYRVTFKSPSIKETNDVRRNPNDTFMSYLMADNDLSHSELVDILKKPKRLQTLVDIIPNKRLPDSMSRFAKDMVMYIPPDITGSLIMKNTNKVAIAEQFTDGVNFVVADIVPKTFKFPSGKTIDYFLMKNEQVANESIFTFGYANTDTSNIYLRENFFKFNNALKIALKDNLEIKPYQDIFDLYEKQCIAPASVHEEEELKIVKLGIFPGNSLAKELLVEKNTKQVLEQNGIDPRIYELHHILRAGPKKSQDIPRIIVDNNFEA